MNIFFNTTQPHAPCSVFYIDALKRLDNVTFHNQDFNKCDIALFMTYDHMLIKGVKESYPHLKIGIIDPRSSAVYESTKYCDFIIIDSIEMEDFWRMSRKPIFKYVEYPDIQYMQKTHEKKDKITIGYHGNQIHLECMAENVTPALNELGKKYNLELLIMHNGHRPSGEEEWYPQNISVRHVPWSMDHYIKYLAESDIGIVPNNLIHDTSAKNLIKTNKNFNYTNDDYSLRFKMPSNPGRFVIFGKLGIPVVSDFYPSAIQYLQNNVGFVAHSSAGWHHCLEKLITSHQLRQEMGGNLQSLVRQQFDFDVQNEKLISFLGGII